MPIVIDDLINEITHTHTDQTPTWTPKYFHKELNGNGRGSGGRLSASNHPANPDKSFTPDPTPRRPKKFTDPDNNLEIRYIPVTPVLLKTLRAAAKSAMSVADDRDADALNHNLSAPADLDDHPYFMMQNTPNAEGMFNINEALSTTVDNYHFFADFDPERVSIRKKKTVTTDGSSVTKTTTHVDYHVCVVAVHDDDLTIIKHTDGSVEYEIDRERLPYVTNTSAHMIARGAKSFMLGEVTDTPFETMQKLVFDLQSVLDRVGGYQTATINEAEFHTWSENVYSLYERISANAETMGTDAIAERVVDLIEQIDYFASEKHRITGDYPSAMWNAVLWQLRYMEFFDVTLTAYSTIFDALVNLNEPEIGIELSKHNLQLSFNANLKALVGVKDQLPVPLAPGQTSTYMPDPRFSQQQLDPITTQSPLVMVKAGAGTGKTTVILEHVKFLTGCGIPLGDIEAWSFTNAAADNMTDRFPGIQSSTIAKAYMDIYEYNFPTHKLSTMETILTSLQIYYGEAIGMDDTLSAFYRLVKEGAKQTNSSMTALANFVEANLVSVLRILNEIRQTSLELALIISYLMIDDPSFKSNRKTPQYLIIDEVQDNSVFEFVYALKYATRNRCAVFVVGDPSQTLYEFRSANPKALNALEMSGVFDTFALTTNYRSNQEILDFANVHLRDIETNRITQIELKANLLAAPTEATFTEKVKLKRVFGTKQQEFTDNIPAYFRSDDVRSFIDEKLAAGERICVLGARRIEVAKAMDTLTKMYPNIPVVNLTSERPFNNTTFSKFVATHWNSVTAVDPQYAALTFQRELVKNLSSFEHDAVRAEPRIRKMLAEWWLSVKRNYLGWVQHYQAVLGNPGATQDDIDKAKQLVFTNLRESILSYEIRHNAINQSLKTKRNEERKNSQEAQTSQLLVSTIHGAKGLEFDNTIIIQKPKAILDEDEKRMFYVAYTRAQKAELIIAGSGDVQSKVVSDYDSVVELLRARDAKIATLTANPRLQAGLQARGMKLDDMDLEATLAKFDAEGIVVDEEQFLDAVVFIDPDTGEAITSDADDEPDTQAANPSVGEALSAALQHTPAPDAETRGDDNNAAATPQQPSPNPAVLAAINGNSAPAAQPAPTNDAAEIAALFNSGADTGNDTWG